MVHSSYLLWEGDGEEKKTQLNMAAQLGYVAGWMGQEVGFGPLVKQEEEDGFFLLHVPPDQVQCIVQTF